MRYYASAIGVFLQGNDSEVICFVLFLVFIFYTVNTNHVTFNKEIAFRSCQMVQIYQVMR